MSYRKYLMKDDVQPSELYKTVKIDTDSDTISRQAAIDAVGINTWAGQRLLKVPPAQPEIVPCDYAKACNEVSMNRIASAVVYMEVLEDFKKYGYVLVDMSENMPLDNNSEIPNSSDTISRSKAIDALEKDKKALEHIINGMSGYEKEFDRFVGQRNQVDYDIHAIEQLPSTQPERIKGRWIAKEKKNLFRCSKCDAVIYSESEYDRNEFYKFCGRCGADMREVTT